jgi:hypothetical protein
MSFLVILVAVSVGGAGIALSQTLSLDDQTATMVEEEVIFTLSIDYPSSESGRIGSVTIDVNFDHNVLTFDPPEYSREDGEPYPLHGTLFANWAALDVSNPSDGQLKVVGFTIGGLQPGDSGEIVQLPFIVNAMANAELTISAQDALATFSTQSGQFTFELPPANNPPVAMDDMETTEQDTPVTIDVLANDEDADGESLTVTGKTDGSDGTVAITGNGATVTYTPSAGYTGSDEFTYTVSDGTDTDMGTVTVTVTAPPPPANNAPVAMDDTADTDEDESVVINVLANDTDADGDTLTVTMATEPSDGEAVVADDGMTITYTPDTGYSGEDQFMYTVSDGEAADTATVYITVEAAEPVEPVDPGTGDNGDSGGGGGGCTLNPGGRFDPTLVSILALFMGVYFVRRFARRQSLR